MQKHDQKRDKKHWNGLRNTPAPISRLVRIETRHHHRCYTGSEINKTVFARSLFIRKPQ